jgi:hypothetical protein
MPTINARIYELAELALSVTHNDVAGAVNLLCEWTGLSFEFAFEAIDAIVMVQLAKSGGDAP